MGEFSLLHWLIIGALLMIFFAPHKLKEAGSSIGKAIRGFKEGMNEIEVEARELPPLENSSSSGPQKKQPDVASQRDKSENKS